MMTSLNLEQSLEISNLCHRIASLNSQICSISCINKNGRVIETKLCDDRIFTDLSPQELEMLYMQRKLQTSMNRELDEKFGTMNYIVSDRDSVLEFIFPFYDGIILVITRPEIIIQNFAKKTSKIITKFKFGEEVQTLR